MPLLTDALTWESMTAGGADADLHIGDGIEGLDLPDGDYDDTSHPFFGAIAGSGEVGGRDVATDVWLDADTHPTAFMDIRRAMMPRLFPGDELALAWAGLGWPDGEYCVFARPRRARNLVDEDGVHGAVPGLDLSWRCADPVVYSYEAAEHLWPTGAPVATDTFEVANAGWEVPFARRAWRLRMTAHGTVANPKVRVDHADGTFEEVTFLTAMSGGQVLTVEADGYARVGTRIVGRFTSKNETGLTSPVRLPWRLLASDGSDGANEVTVSVASGSFSGWLRTRSTWL